MEDLAARSLIKPRASRDLGAAGVGGGLEPRSAPWAPGPQPAFAFLKPAPKRCCRQLVPAA